MNEPDPQGEADALAEELEPAELLQELLEEIAGALGLDAEVEVEEEAGVLYGRVEGEDVGLLIGRHGHTIESVQHLAQRIVFPGGPAGTRIVIDAGGYRERRAQVLRDDADDAAEEALRTGRAVEFEALPASERRIVHEYLRDRADVTTQSEGEEPDRYVVVSPSES